MLIKRFIQSELLFYFQALTLNNLVAESPVVCHCRTRIVGSDIFVCVVKRSDRLLSWHCFDKILYCTCTPSHMLWNGYMGSEDQARTLSQYVYVPLTRPTK